MVSCYLRLLYHRGWSYECQKSVSLKVADCSYASANSTFLFPVGIEVFAGYTGKTVPGWINILFIFLVTLTPAIVVPTIIMRAVRRLKRGCTWAEAFATNYSNPTVSNNIVTGSGSGQRKLFLGSSSYIDEAYEAQEMAKYLEEKELDQVMRDGEGFDYEEGRGQDGRQFVGGFVKSGTLAHKNMRSATTATRSDQTASWEGQ